MLSLAPQSAHGATIPDGRRGISCKPVAPLAPVLPDALPDAAPSKTILPLCNLAGSACGARAHSEFGPPPVAAPVAAPVPPSLRSGFATVAAESGADERSIMAMTGHKTTQMVRRYIREANIFKNNALNKIKI